MIQSRRSGHRSAGNTSSEETSQRWNFFAGQGTDGFPLRGKPILHFTVPPNGGGKV